MKVLLQQNLPLALRRLAPPCTGEASAKGTWGSGKRQSPCADHAPSLCQPCAANAPTDAAENQWWHCLASLWSLMPAKCVVMCAISQLNCSPCSPVFRGVAQALPARWEPPCVNHIQSSVLTSAPLRHLKLNPQPNTLRQKGMKFVPTLDGARRCGRLLVIPIAMSTRQLHTQVQLTLHRFERKHSRSLKRCFIKFEVRCIS